MELNFSVVSQYPEALWRKQWKNSIEGRYLPQTSPSTSHFVHAASIELFSHCHQGDTGDLGWVLLAEEFSFAKASDKCNSTLRPHNHYPSQSGCGHYCLHSDHDATFVLQLSSVLEV